VEGIAGVQGLANGQEDEEKVFSEKTFIARYDFMDIKGSALGLGKRKVSRYISHPIPFSLI